ncbi:hypothetical protein [Streptomyces jeddahensis]|uniref:Uncharacterized protein n=1 Tax=Streptomyces jeddahensis TaxID=1716141 RepID=A0A177I1H1_9ACTN|nr:hypothetical protein [Streptomyces jeddahensis]OAH16394.1 hypothetical protein STSP_02690 [Streptomyces jeddahensis]
MGTLRAVRVLNGSKVAVHQRATLLSERPLNVALLVLDPETTAGLGATNRDILTRVADQVAAANARLARVEQTRQL